MKSRKFILALLGFLTSTLLLVLGFIDAEVWKLTAPTILGLYFTANVAQKATARE